MKRFAICLTTFDTDLLLHRSWHVLNLRLRHVPHLLRSTSDQARQNVRFQKADRNICIVQLPHITDYTAYLLLHRLLHVLHRRLDVRNLLLHRWRWGYLVSPLLHRATEKWDESIRDIMCV